MADDMTEGLAPGQGVLLPDPSEGAPPGFDPFDALPGILPPSNLTTPDATGPGGTLSPVIPDGADGLDERFQRARQSVADKLKGAFNTETASDAVSASAFYDATKRATDLLDRYDRATGAGDEFGRLQATEDMEAMAASVTEGLLNADGSPRASYGASAVEGLQAAGDAAKSAASTLGNAAGSAARGVAYTAVAVVLVFALVYAIARKL